MFIFTEKLVVLCKKYVSSYVTHCGTSQFSTIIIKICSTIIYTKKKNINQTMEIASASISIA